MFYFAYGSNMNLKQMSLRCPGAVIMGQAEAKGWGLRERQYADIEMSPKENVLGVLWRISATHLYHLDLYEGVAQGFYYKINLLVNYKGKEGYAIAYVMHKEAAHMRRNLAFTSSYRKGCKQGAIENKIEVHPLYEERTKNENLYHCIY